MASAPAAPTHTMKYRYLGNSGLLASRLSFGSCVSFDGNFGFDGAYDIMVKAFQDGINFFKNAGEYAWDLDRLVTKTDKLKTHHGGARLSGWRSSSSPHWWRGSARPSLTKSDSQEWWPNSFSASSEEQKVCDERTTFEELRTRKVPSVCVCESKWTDLLVMEQCAGTSDGAADTAPAALCMLTNSTLFQLVTDFMPGVPFFVLAFAKHIEPKYKPKYSHWFRQWRGVLPFMAIKENNVRVLEALYELQRIPCYRSNAKLQFHRVVLAAAKYGRLEILKWLYEKAKTSENAQLVWDSGLMKEAIWHRHVDIMDWLYTTCPLEIARGDAGGVEHIDWAEQAGIFGVVQWLHHHGYAFTPREMDQAAEHGHLDVVRFLHDHRAEGCTTRAMDAAAANGYLEIVKFLHHHRTEGCTARAIDSAALRGHLEIVTFLHEQRHEGCTKTAMDSAAMNNHVKIIRYLGMYRREGCSSTTLLKITKYGNTATVRALCEYSRRGCLVEAKQIAIAWKHAHVVAVLNEFLSESVRTCSTAQHSQNGPRRCQKLKTNSSSNTRSTAKKMKSECRKQSTTRRSWYVYFDGIRGFFRHYHGQDHLLFLPPSMYHSQSFHPS